jgi:hypothetical protein
VDGGAHRPRRPAFVLSTRTAAEASQGALMDRLRELRPRARDGEPAGPAWPPLAVRAGPPRVPREAVASLPPSARPSRAAARDHVRLAAQDYARALVRAGIAPLAAVEAVRVAVHEGAAFLPARRLAALERAVVYAARAVC